MLSPYRVLDLTDHRGQMAGFILAALGAEVTLVEPPGGSPARHRPPLAPGTDIGLEWWAYNRGKSSVIVSDHQQLLELAATTDVLIENATPGSGPQYGELAAANPSIVHVSITPFGSSGPKATWPANDLTICAAGCVMALTGDSDRAPVRTTVPQAWLHAAGDAATGALLALVERARSGRGQHVDVSAQASILQAAIPGIFMAPNGNAPLGRIAGGIAYGPFRLQFVYPASDGFVSVTLLFGDTIGPFTARLMAWVHEAGFCDAALANLDWNEFGTRLFVDPTAPPLLEVAKAAITELTRSHSKAELFAEAQRRRLLVAPVTTPAELVAFEQFSERQYWEKVEDPTLGTVVAPGPFARPSRSPLRRLGPPPALPNAPAPASTSAEASGQRGTPRPAETSPDSTEPRALPLAGLKVVDLTWVYAGPLSTRVLADYGATVVKVEGPTRPDASRGGGGWIKGDMGLESSVQFASFNAHKLGLALDLSAPEGRAVLVDLARWADVLIESYTPGVMAAWGLDYTELARHNPGLVMVSTSLMGQSGPLTTFAGFGNLAGAITGYYELTGWPDRSPAGPFLAYTDYIAPRLTVAALLAALEWRDRNGGAGQHIDFSQAEAAVHFLVSAILEHTVAGANPTRAGNADRFNVPVGAFQCSGDDRWVAVGCETDEEWAALAAIIGRADLAHLTVAERVDRRDEIDALLSAWTANQSDASAEATLIAAGVAAHRVQNSPECFADPQLIDREHFVTVEHPVHGSVVIEASRFRLSATEGSLSRSGPLLGEHNQQVLSELLGYDDDRIASLVIAGALG